MRNKYLQGFGLVSKLITEVLPGADKEIARWKDICGRIHDEELQIQAAESISSKAFHIYGGGVYSLYPGTCLKSSIEFIAAFQTISDYLDNLCDRAGVFEETAFRQLHLSMLDCISADRSPGDYYLHYPYKADGNYLSQLVETCRKNILKLPSYPLVREVLIKYVSLYTDLQSLKHIDISSRGSILTEWADSHVKNYPGLFHWEFSAAAGSTLGIFMMHSMAQHPDLTAEEVERADSAYFPWICCLHILLDYYIDRSEDLMMGDYNFTECYSNQKQCESRLIYILNKSLECCRTLEYPGFHTTVVHGLIGMYLSDPKAFTGINRLSSKALLEAGPSNVRHYFRMCRLLRFFGRL